ncbi:hypothetical protein LOCC1_G001933 [Lachnellula occidentalis]|uniref:DSBA-like thioredoxin domain-containing protein n=1 Tax=Lachnellula occidentalis TaxID=215460 RepID=A0A8H8S6Q8_9HELO|nr:hypothetical protein LOCC1_G001933 [Lachnellula occidentalis]
MTQFNIEVVSDTVCPWCYVGKQKLEKAISAYKTQHPDSNDTFSTTWMPFYLNPGAPKVGVDKTAYYRSKFGDDRTELIFERLSQVGKDMGINFKFGGKTGNTRDSHRLIQLGKLKSPAIQTRVVEELFAAYFENEGGKAVDEEVEAAQSQQISGVPNFTIQGKYEIGGAQDPGVFLRLFEKIKATEEGAKA